MGAGIIFLIVDNYALDVSEPSLGVEASATPPGSLAEMMQVVLPNSVAVLPFDNLTLDPENAFFAAGIHEELLNQLVKLRNLSVISRTTMSRYADSDLSIPEIGQELNVETVMEGSVRYSDDRVRVVPARRRRLMAKRRCPTGLRLGALAGLLPRQVPRRCGPLLSRQLVRLGGAGGGGAFRPKFG